MNFIKTLKFSVKGIDTTRYIPSEVRNLLLYVSGWSWRSEKSPFPTINEGYAHFRNDTKCRPERSEGPPSYPRERLKNFLGGVGGGHSPPPFIVISSEARDLLCSSPLVIKASTARHLTNLTG
jgi:hypothetical protein